MENQELTKSQTMRLNKLAREIIEKNQYLSLATSDKDGKPWISPVCYTYDNNWNLYFVSIPTSKHGQNTKNNKQVAFSIFDSRQKWGLGIGLQIEGKIKELNLRDSLIPARLYVKRDYPYGNPDSKIVFKFIKDYLKNKKIYKFYKLTAKKVFINNPYSTIDYRVMVNLNETIG